MPGIKLYYVGTVRSMLERYPPDRFIFVFCESFMLSGYVSELRNLLRKYYENSLFALDGFDGVFVL